MSHLLRILEIKRTWDGREKRFECTVLARAGTHLVVLFVSEGEMRVHDVLLPAGTVTFGHFWTDRPYNVYHWLDGSTGDTLGYYFNVSEDTRVEDDTLSWRDLIVDVLVSPAGLAVVLDEDEIPADAPEPLRARIREACAAVLRDEEALRRELERHRDILWRRHRAGGRPA